MGKIIRRTVTITITETWTIVWTTEDTSQPQATTIVQDQPKTQEKQDEALQTTIIVAEPGDPSASDPTAPPLPPATATDAQSDDVTAKPSAGGQRKRARSHRAKGD